MIISRTPFRISFFGGGTDYPVWYRENGGAVLSTTIDKYCYITLRYLPPFFPYKHRIVYSNTETVKDIEEIVHPAVKAALKFMNVEKGMEIHHDGDLPARSGLGSSSSFTVGMLNSLYALKGSMVPKSKLAKEAIYIERDVLKENVGVQDQIAAAFGGLNRITFGKDEKFIVEPITIGADRKKELESCLMLFFTGFSRTASEIAKAQIENTPQKSKELNIMRQMVDEALGILCGSGDISDFGRLLNKTWELKRSLTNKISNPEIDKIYEKAKFSGALGGKILGAGGGGFMLLFVPSERKQKIREALNGLLEVPFHFDNGGSQIIYYNLQDLT